MTGSYETREREVDVGIGHQVGLEFCQVNIQGSVKPEEGCDKGHSLANEVVQVSIGGALDIEVSMSDITNGLIV